MSPTRDARTSLWWGRRSPGPDSAVRVGDLPGAADVVVVGAGLTGLCTAVLLARSGRPPVVLEGRAVGAGTTGHSTAKLSLLQGSVLQRLRQHAGRQATRAYVEANRSGRDWLLDVLLERGVEVQSRDAMTYAVTSDGARLVRREGEVARAVGLPVVDLDDGDAAGLPFPVRAAILLPDQHQFDPLEVLGALRAELEERGGTVVEDARVTGMSWSRPWRVRTTRGDLVTDRVVLATQTPVLDRGLHFARLTAHRSYALAYEAPEHADLPRGMSLSLDDPARSLRTAPHAGREVLLVGGNDHEVGRGGSARARVEDLHDWTRRHFPVGDPLSSWSAQDYRTARQVPCVGPVPGTGGGLLVATGFDKWGMTNAAAAAHVLAGDLLGRPPAYAAGLRSIGMSPRDVADAVRHNASVGARWVGDRVVRTVPGGVTGDPPEGVGHVEGGPLGPTATSTVDGRTYRVSAVCTHLGGVLTWNDAERSWDCPLHGSRFAADGTRLEGPATKDLDARAG